MGILESFYGVVYGTLLVVVTLKLIVLFQKSMEIIKVVRNKELQIERLKDKELIIDDINRLTNYEYMLFCKNYFKQLGYEHFNFLKNKEDVKEIICVKNNNRILIYRETSIINNKEILSFIGSMVKNNVYEGIIICSGKIDNSAMKVVNKNKNKFDIKFVDIKEIIEKEANKQYSVIESLT